ncbi:MAG: general stress protein [Rhodospirillales bacterium]|jgi:hypothetical protein|nr:general stress protein [Rhodospirillales bacterium]
MTETGADTPTVTVREAVGVFNHQDSLQAAIDDLLEHGFDRAEISVLASEKAVADKLGHLYQRVSELEDDPNTPRTAFVSKDDVTEAKAFAISGLGYVGAVAAVGIIVASGGTLAAVIGGALAAGGVGAGLGSVLARAIGRESAKNIETQIARGGILLWVRTRDPLHETRAVEVLKKHGGSDVHIHDIVTQAEPEDDPLTGMQPDPFLPNAKV